MEPVGANLLGEAKKANDDRKEFRTDTIISYDTTWHMGGKPSKSNNFKPGGFTLSNPDTTFKKTLIK